MLESLIRKGLTEGKSIINLPCGEFKENVIIDRPCTIVGNDTTLWNESLPVLVVQSKGVSLKNLRLELVSIGGFESSYPVLKLQDDTTTENVEIFGGLADTPKYYIPRIVHLGKMKSNCENTFKLRIFSPEKCTVIIRSNNLMVEPTYIDEGYSVITIKTSALNDNSMVYNEILLRSKLIRRVYVDGYASNKAQQVIDKVVYSYENVDTSTNGDVILFNVPKVDTPPKRIECKVLNRGERTVVDNLNFSIKLNYESYSSIGLDVDPYIFLTDAYNDTRCSQDMVFFGNTTDTDMSICIQSDNSILMDLSKVPNDVQKVSICYSVYKGDYDKNFSAVLNPVLTITDLNDYELFKIPLKGLGRLSTVIVAEIYRYKNIWKVNPVVAGYSDGLPKLCQSFGIDAEY